MKSKTAAMEMSVGTIVTIVLLMTVLILGLVMVRSIFKTSTSSIDAIDQSVKNEIDKLFADESKTIGVYPPSRRVTLDKTDDEPRGFAFSIKSSNEPPADGYTYEVKVDPTFNIAQKCGSGVTSTKVESWLVSGTTSTIPPLSANTKSDPNDGLILFELPDDAPACTIPFILNVEKGYASAKVFVTIQ